MHNRSNLSSIPERSDQIIIEIPQPSSSSLDDEFRQCILLLEKARLNHNGRNIAFTFSALITLASLASGAFTIFYYVKKLNEIHPGSDPFNQFGAALIKLFLTAVFILALMVEAACLSGGVALGLMSKTFDPKQISDLSKEGRDQLHALAAKIGMRITDRDPIESVSDALRKKQNNSVSRQQTFFFADKNIESGNSMGVAATEETSLLAKNNGR